MKDAIIKTSKFKLKNFDEETRVVKGLAAGFGNKDSDNDIIKAGAFNRTIKALGPEGRDMIKLCAQHNMEQPIGSILKLEETPDGLYIEAKFGTHTLGDDYYRMTKEGIINEFSVGFAAIQKEENTDGGYDFSEVKLYEVSMVTVAANDKAVVTDIKSADPMKLVKQVQDKDLAFKLEYEIKKLQSEVQETPTPLAEKAPDSEVEQEEKAINWNAFAEALKTK